MSDGDSKACKGRTLSALLIVVCAASLCLTTPAFAGVGVTPSKIELTMEAGDSETFEVVVTTDNKEPMITSINAWDFARDEQGQIKPVSSEDADTFHGCSSWVQLPFTKEQELVDKQTTFELTVEVPVDAPDGTRYCYLSFDTSPVPEETDSDDPSVSFAAPVTYSMNAMLLVQVGDPSVPPDTPAIQQGVTVRDFNVARFNLDPEVKLETAIFNKGNVHASLEQGSGILIMQGDTVKQELPFQEFTLLPDDTIAIPVVFESSSPFGVYTARFIGNLGGDEPLVAEETFVVVQPWLLATVAGALIAFAALLMLFFKRFKLQLAPRSQTTGNESD